MTLPLACHLLHAQHSVVAHVATGAGAVAVRDLSVEPGFVIAVGDGTGLTGDAGDAV